MKRAIDYPKHDKENKCVFLAIRAATAKNGQIRMKTICIRDKGLCIDNKKDEG